MLRPTSYRKFNWFDSLRNVPIFGIQGKVDGVWRNIGDDMSMYQFQKEQFRDEKLKELRRELRTQSKSSK